MPREVRDAAGLQQEVVAPKGLPVGHVDPRLVVPVGALQTFGAIEVDRIDIGGFDHAAKIVRDLLRQRCVRVMQEPVV